MLGGGAAHDDHVFLTQRVGGEADGQSRSPSDRAGLSQTDVGPPQTPCSTATRRRVRRGRVTHSVGFGMSGTLTSLHAKLSRLHVGMGTICVNQRIASVKSRGLTALQSGTGCTALALLRLELWF